MTFDYGRIILIKQASRLPICSNFLVYLRSHIAPGALIITDRVGLCFERLMRLLYYSYLEYRYSQSLVPRGINVTKLTLWIIRKVFIESVFRWPIFRKLVRFGLMQRFKFSAKRAHAYSSFTSFCSGWADKIHGDTIPVDGNYMTFTRSGNDHTFDAKSNADKAGSF